MAEGRGNWSWYILPENQLSVRMGSCRAASHRDNSVRQELVLRGADLKQRWGHQAGVSVGTGDMRRTGLLIILAPVCPLTCPAASLYQKQQHRVVRTGRRQKALEAVLSHLSTCASSCAKLPAPFFAASHRAAWWGRRWGGSRSQCSGEDSLKDSSLQTSATVPTPMCKSVTAEKVVTYTFLKNHV